MNKESRQTMILTGVALTVIASVILFASLKQPRVYDKNVSEAAFTQTETQKSETGSYQTTTTTVSVTNPQSSNTSAPYDKTEAVYEYPINLNTATIEELMSIDGIGETRAGAIIEYREYLGGYTSVEQITEIKGIDDAVYYKVAGYLSV